MKLVRSNSDNKFSLHSALKCLSILFCILGSSLSEPILAQEEQEEIATLTLGSVDNNQYGQNYGRNGNTSRLDVQFTPEAGKEHELSWQPYDVEDGEMTLFLNDVRIKTIPSTSNDQLGAIDRLTVPASNLSSGVNTLSFRVTESDGTWGVTRLLATAKADLVPEDPASRVLLDSPQEQAFSRLVRSYDYNFNFAPRGTYYDETVRVEFDSYLRHGTLNGFRVRLNGQTIGLVATFEGRATTRTFSFSIDKSQVDLGSNTLKIETTSSSVVANFETKLSNVKVVASSIPLLNLSVASVSVPASLELNTPFDATATVANVGGKTTSTNTLSFYISFSKGLSNPTLVASKIISAIAGETSITETITIDSRSAQNNRYLFACVDHAIDDVLASDDCSSAIQLDVESPYPIAPIILLLLAE